jgi:IS5 family transposase
MTQMPFADTEYASKRKRTRRKRFLIETDQRQPWKGLISLIEQHYSKGGGDRPAYPLMALLQVHLVQAWLDDSVPPLEEALYEAMIPLQFSGAHLGRIPYDATILNFRYLLENYELARGISPIASGPLVDAMFIHALSSKKNKDGKRNSEMHQTKQDKMYFFRMKAYIFVDVESGLVCSVASWGQCSGPDSDRSVTALRENLRRRRCGYTCMDKRPEPRSCRMIWSVPICPSCYIKHEKKGLVSRLRCKIEYDTAYVRAKAEDPFLVIER